jgi:hypothetical protein
MKLQYIIALSLVLQTTYAQNSTISGKVLDSQTKQPLAFVSIGIEGTRQGTVSDIDGKFTILTSPQSVFLVSYVGFESKRVVVANLGKGQVIIELVQKNNDIGEVVVRRKTEPHRPTNICH